MSSVEMNQTGSEEYRLLKTSIVVMASARAFPDLGGIESHIFEVSTRSVGRLAAIHVQTTDRSGSLSRREDVSGVAIKRSRAFPRNRDYYLSPGLFGDLLRKRYDLLHVQGVHTLVPPLAMLAALSTRRPYVVTFHTGGSSSKLRATMRGPQFLLLRPLLRRASALIAVSEYEQDLFSRRLGVPPEEIYVIRNGGMEASAGDDPIEREPGLIVSVGRLERYKGHHRLIEALPQLLQMDGRHRVKIIGRGPYEDELRALAARLGVADAVEFTFVPPENRELMRRLLAGAEVAVLLSDYEAHPVAVMEALAVQTPVVVRETSGMTELARKGWVRGVAPDASVRAIVDAVRAQVADPQVPPSESLPTWESCVTELHEVYERVLQSSTTPQT